MLCAVCRQLSLCVFVYKQRACTINTKLYYRSNSSSYLSTYDIYIYKKLKYTYNFILLSRGVNNVPRAYDDGVRRHTRAVTAHTVDDVLLGTVGARALRWPAELTRESAGA